MPVQRHLYDLPLGHDVQLNPGLSAVLNHHDLRTLTCVGAFDRRSRGRGKFAVTYNYANADITVTIHLQDARDPATAHALLEHELRTLFDLFLTRTPRLAPGVYPAGVVPPARFNAAPPKPTIDVEKPMVPTLDARFRLREDGIETIKDVDAARALLALPKDKFHHVCVRFREQIGGHVPFLAAQMRLVDERWAPPDHELTIDHQDFVDFLEAIGLTLETVLNSGVAGAKAAFDRVASGRTSCPRPHKAHTEDRTAVWI